jgi:polysaccharide pyruvyl transferase WcaK-like protein
MRETDLVLPWGIFGSGNIGDEAMLQGFAELIRSNGAQTSRVWVAARNPSHSARVVPDFRYYKFGGRISLARRRALQRSKAHLIVGDTPIMDYLGSWPLTDIVKITNFAQTRSKKIACVGVGTEQLLDDRSISKLRDQIAPLVEHWTVRTAEDKLRLGGYGVAEERVTVAADLAWLVAPVDTSLGRRWLRELGSRAGAPIVGVNVTRDMWSIRQAPHLLDAVAAALDSIIATHDADIMFFANEVRTGPEFDSAAIEEVLGRAKRPERMFRIPNRYWQPQEALSFIACCSATLTMRYHFALFSALQGVPFVSLSRLGKLKDLCADMRWPHDLSLADANAEAMKSHLGSCLADGRLLDPVLQSSTRRLHDRAGRNIRSIQAVLD